MVSHGYIYLAIASHGYIYLAETNLGTIMVPLRVSTDRPRKTSRGHNRRPKPAILKASVSVDTMADISESIDVWRSDGSMRIGKWFVW
jgi:hypothetical protein